MNTIQIAITIGSIILLLSMPSSTAIQYLPTTSSVPSNQSSLQNKPLDSPPAWFSVLYTIIIYSLQKRIVFITPLAITPTGSQDPYYEVNNYVFFLLLLTLVYRFAFWYTFLHKIADKHGWDITEDFSSLSACITEKNNRHISEYRELIGKSI